MMTSDASGRSRLMEEREEGREKERPRERERGDGNDGAGTAHARTHARTLWAGCLPSQRAAAGWLSHCLGPPAGSLCTHAAALPNGPPPFCALALGGPRSAAAVLLSGFFWPSPKEREREKRKEGGPAGAGGPWMHASRARAPACASLQGRQTGTEQLRRFRLDVHVRGARGEREGWVVRVAVVVV